MYKVIRTDTADTMLRSIVLYVAQKFGNDIALEKLDYLEKSVMALERNPHVDLFFCKVEDDKKLVTVYAIVDQRQDYINIIRGL